MDFLFFQIRPNILKKYDIFGLIFFSSSKLWHFWDKIDFFSLIWA